MIYGYSSVLSKSWWTIVMSACFMFDWWVYARVSSPDTIEPSRNSSVVTTDVWLMCVGDRSRRIWSPLSDRRLLRCLIDVSLCSVASSLRVKRYDRFCLMGLCSVTHCPQWHIKRWLCKSSEVMQSINLEIPFQGEFCTITILVVGILRQYPWQYECRSGSLPKILQYRVWPISRKETFITHVHWPNLPEEI